MTSAALMKVGAHSPFQIWPLLVRKGGEDHNSANRNSDKRKDRNAVEIAHFCNQTWPNKSPTDDGVRGSVGRGTHSPE